MGKPMMSLRAQLCRLVLLLAALLLLVVEGMKPQNRGLGPNARRQEKKKPPTGRWKGCNPDERS